MATPQVPDNPNIVWASLFVDALAQAGLTEVCVAPGSRSTPLALAFWAHPAIHVYRHLDERGAGFFALGVALAAERPVALLCTSGTAVANFLPAIVEATMSQVPLLVLTADRPPELRHSGANQTIDQVKIFGDQVLWSVDIALPQTGDPPVALRNLRALAARALARADGLVKGPVHLNFPLRKPLEPEHLDALLSLPPEAEAPPVRIELGQLLPSEEQISALAAVVQHHPEGLIVCGPRCPAGDFPRAVGRLAQACGYPLLADPLSNVRFGSAGAEATLIGGYETFLQAGASELPAPQLILRFGALPTSKWLNSLLAGTGTAPHIHVRANGVWADEHHTTSLLLQVDETALCRSLASHLDRAKSGAWLQRWRDLETKTWQRLALAMRGTEFDGAFVADLLDALPPGVTLFAGNSLPVRHVDQFGRPQERPLRVFANRGASGIDGNLATGLGIAAASAGPVVILVGDITFYHDSNSLLALRQLALPNVTIVLLNNNGGGIFRRLPVSRLEPAFQELFLTPPDLDFAPLAAAYGLEHTAVASRSAFRAALEQALAATTGTLIEVQTDGAEDERSRRRLIKQALAPTN